MKKDKCRQINLRLFRSDKSILHCSGQAQLVAKIETKSLMNIITNHCSRAGQPHGYHSIPLHGYHYTIHTFLWSFSTYMQSIEAQHYTAKPSICWWLNLENAYGSVYHQLIHFTPNHYHGLSKLVHTVVNLYASLSATVTTAATEEDDRERLQKASVTWIPRPEFFDLLRMMQPTSKTVQKLPQISSQVLLKQKLYPIMATWQNGGGKKSSQCL